MQAELLASDTPRAQIREIWLPLESACQPRYWLRWAWVETWLDSLPAAMRPALVVIRDAGQAVAAFFVRVSPSTRYHVLRSRAAHLNETGVSTYDLLHIEYNRWLCEPSLELDLRRVLDSLPFEWEELNLNRLDSRALPGRDLRGLDGKYRVQITAQEPSPYVDLAAVRAASGGYLSLIGGNTRSAIRRARKAYAEIGPLRIEIAQSLDEARSFLAELAELSMLRFEDAVDGSSFGSRYFRTFHDTLIRRRFEHGEIQLIRIRAGEATIGLVYNFVSDGVVHFYQSGFRYETDNRFRPGLLLHAEAIEHNAAAGHRVYDFLGGTARYKRDLSTHVNELFSARIQRQLPKFIVEGQLRELRTWVRETIRQRSAKRTPS